MDMRMLFNQSNFSLLNNLEKIFFSFFLFFIPIQLRITFPGAQTYSFGFFNEYATYFVYLSDILFITTLFILFVNMLTKRQFIGIKLNFLSTYPRLIPIFTLLVTLITWVFVDIKLNNQGFLSFYQSIKLIELSLIFIYVALRLKNYGYKKFAVVLFVSGLFQSIIGIFQFYLQQSVGLKILMESSISPNTINVAKIIVNDDKLIRAYGTFPHPNIFAGFLVFSIVCSIYLLLLYLSELNCKKARSLPILNSYQKIVSRETILLFFISIGLFVQVLALILTFSRSAWLSILTIFPLTILILIKRNQIEYIKLVLSESFFTDRIKKLFHVKQFDPKIIISTISLIVISVFLLNPYGITERINDSKSVYQESIVNRFLYQEIAIKIIMKHPYLGIGGSNFTLAMTQYSDNKLEFWQYQPVHNIYLLIASEYGLIGLIIFVSFIYSVFIYKNNQNTLQIVSRETFCQEMDKKNVYLFNALLKATLIGYLIIGLLDHYLWTIQQGRLIFWVLLAAIISTSIDRPNISTTVKKNKQEF